MADNDSINKSPIEEYVKEIEFALKTNNNESKLIYNKNSNLNPQNVSQNTITNEILKEGICL